MPRRNVERKTSGYCKIRKRVSSSSSSAATSSSLVKSYRLRRAILVAKRVKPSTPIPSWKMDLRSPSLAKHGDKGKEAQTSARRLAASLWEFNGGGEEEKENFKGGHAHLMDQSRSPVCKKDGSKQPRHLRRSSDKLQLIEYVGEGDDSVHHGASIEVTSHGAVDKGPSVASRLKQVSTSLTASNELVKVLFRMCSREEHSSSNLTLVSALKVEIDRARHQVDRVMHQKRYTQKEIDALLKQFAYEKAAWKSKEQERICNAVSSVTRELEVEKKLRRQTERLNKTLGRELADTKDQLNKVVEELGCERKARQILEQTYDELATGLGNDNKAAEVEELRRECDKVREETERERQMLQLADVLREERVQMKLADARYEYEEKNAALERLRTELETYFGGKLRDTIGEMRRHIIDDGDVGEDGEEDSGESELHSIELNMDDNLSKSYKWSYGNEGSASNSRRASVEEMFKGRRSLNEKIQWESICLQRKTSDGLDYRSLLHKDDGNDHKSVKGEDSSRPQSPPELGDSKTASVDSGDQIDNNKDGET